MPKSIISEGKTTAEAIENGLKELNNVSNLGLKTLFNILNISSTTEFDESLNLLSDVIYILSYKISHLFAWFLNYFQHCFQNRKNWIYLIFCEKYGTLFL